MVFLGLHFGRLVNDSMSVFDDLLTTQVVPSPGQNPGILTTPAPVPPTPPPPPLHTPTPLPPSTPPAPPTTRPVPGSSIHDESELFGTWERDSGNAIWFFWMAQKIEFFDNGDGTLGTIEHGEEEYGVWHIDEEGYLIVEGDRSGLREFYISIEDGVLMIVDSDGDTAFYRRAS